ncbi:acyltransferase [Methanobrevibacter sp.]
MERIKYVDTLKFVAILAIIFLHATNIWSGGYIHRLGFSFYRMEELFRYGVPLFVMITGMLTLNRDIDLNDFFKRKTVRLFYPLVFFFIVSYLLGIYDNIFISFWYCWMIIGLYLAIPFINVFVKNADENEMNYLVSLILVSSLIYSLVKIYDFDMALDLDFFIGPASYLILGYYFANRKFNLSSNKIIVISLVVFAVVTVYKVYNKDFLYLNEGIIRSYLNFSFPQILQTVSVFLIFKNVYESYEGLFGKIRNVLEMGWINDFIVSVSRSSYGIYLFQMILFRGYLKPILSTIEMSAVKTFVSIGIVAVTVLFVSWIVILVLSKIPFVDKFSGYA